MTIFVGAPVGLENLKSSNDSDHLTIGGIDVLWGYLLSESERQRTPVAITIVEIAHPLPENSVARLRG